MGHIRAHLDQVDSRDVQRATAALIVVAIHVGLFFVILNSSGRFDGIHDSATPITRLVLLLTHDAREEKSVELPPLDEPADDNSTRDLIKRMLQAPLARFATEDTPPPPSAEVAPALAYSESISTPTQIIHTDDYVIAPTTAPIPKQEQQSIAKRVTQLAERLLKNPQQQVRWQDAGKQYTAALALAPASHGDELDRAIASVSAEDHGKQLTTIVELKRLAFSNFTQMVDAWDPMVQLHDDEIVGRLHINSEFNLMYDGDATPHFLGKVTTAASSFNMASIVRRHEQDIFREGIETRAGRIALPRDVQPFAWTPHDEHTHIQSLEDDAHIEFFGDGSYVLSAGTDSSRLSRENGLQAVYFIASRNATIYVKGIIAGKVLVYSPQRVVIEGSIRYAHDARKDFHAPDYLGLVSDRTVEIARPSVTGPGDLEIDAAIYAGRRFLVADIYTSTHPATLRIFGSVAAGSISATEPRYSTKIEYDTRFEEVRPPGFPATNRFVVSSWNEQWTEVAR